MASLYVVSDVHGYHDDLLHGLGVVGLADAEGRWTGREDQLWVLGDLLDRGPQGIETVQLLRSLQEQAPEHVHVLMGNHEVMALGTRRFPDSDFREVWRVNGGRQRDQDGLDAGMQEWLAALPLMGRHGDFLFTHSDTTAYRLWGGSVEEVNATVRGLLADPHDEQAHLEVFAELCSRYHFARGEGAQTATAFLKEYGGELLVHGHSIIGLLLGEHPTQTRQPLLYADGLVLDIDGGRYEGGPLLLVRLD
jgi:hypothetical protein